MTARHRCGAIAFAVFTPLVALGQLSCIETDRLRLIYLEPLQSYLAPHVARCFHNSLAFQEELFDFQSKEKITLILSDFADYGNAGAGSVPRNGMVVSIAPMSLAYESYPANERMNTLMNHELVHIANFDRPGGWDGFFRGLFAGKVAAQADHPETIVYNYLTSPRSSAPRWFHEGIAVFVETWMAGGLGRAQGSYDEMVFRSMVRDGTRFADPLALVSESTQANFQHEMNSYLYGTRFLSWIAYEHGPQALLEWVQRDDGTRGYFARQFRQVFGESLGAKWEQWGEFERAWQDSNLARLRQYPITPHRDVTRHPLGSVSRAYFEPSTNTLYAALNYPGHVAHLAAIDVQSGQMRRLHDIKDPLMYEVSSLAYDPDGGRLFYTRDHSALRDIVEHDLDSGEERQLLRDARIGGLVFDRSDRSLWGIRHDNGMCTIVRMPEPYTEWNQIRTFSYGTTVSDLDISPDGLRLAFCVVDVSGKGAVQLVERQALISGDATPFASFDFGTTIPGNFTFTPDGSALIGSSYLTGVSNIFRYDVAADSLIALSNTETGFFRPLVAGEDQLLVFRYSGEGFMPALAPAQPLEDVNAIRFLGTELIRKYPELRSWRVGSPAKVALDSLLSYRGPYRALRSIELESLIPIVEGYKQYGAAGLRADWSDPISLHQFHASVSYTADSRLPDNERLHTQLGYNRYDWRASFRYNDADFYDLFGPTKRSIKGWSIGAGNSRTLIFDSPRELTLHTDLAYFGGLERVPDYQNISSSYEELWTGSVRLDWRNRRFSIGAVDYEKGTLASLEVADNHVNGHSFFSALGTLDLGVPLFAHSSIWGRGAIGFAPDDHEEPFANFYFGGFGNNWVDSGDPKRYRSWWSFPGFELNEVGGTNFVKGMLDWNLPPLRFAGLGLPSFHASWMRASVFTTALITNLDVADLRREVLSTGSQLDLRMRLLSHLDLTFSFGYAAGLEASQPRRDEWMFSLKVL